MASNQKEIGERLLAFYNKEVEPRLDVNQAVIDFAIETEIQDNIEVIKSFSVIELNSFGFRTGSNLFDWNNDHDYSIMT
jgi:hypothetical protein